jgi:DNA-binding beta-propeller fold protein YncE
VPFAPIDVPVPLPVAGPFAALCVDAPRRRVFAAGARSVAVIDADTGKLLATIRIAAPISLAVEPLGGHVFAGGADGRISEIDPDRKTVVRTLATPQPVDLLYYDATRGRLYAGEGRADLTTIDARSFLPVGDVPLAGSPAGVAGDPVTGEFYVGFADRPEIAVVDAAGSAVRTSFPAGGGAATAVRFDPGFGQVVVAGVSGNLSVYDRAGTPEGTVAVPDGTSACDLDAGDHLLACAGSGALTFVRLQRDGSPSVAGRVAEERPARAVLDPQTHAAVVVTANAAGGAAAVERIETAPAAP